MNDKYTLENSNQILTNVHLSTACLAERCTVHNKSNHSMRSFPQSWRNDRGLMERICSHGIGHPDPDEIFPAGSYMWVHGCDGCCEGAYHA